MNGAKIYVLKRYLLNKNESECKSQVRKEKIYLKQLIQSGRNYEKHYEKKN